MSGHTPTSYLGDHPDVERSLLPDGDERTALLVAAALADRNGIDGTTGVGVSPRRGGGTFVPAASGRHGSTQPRRRDARRAGEGRPRRGGRPARRTARP